MWVSELFSFVRDKVAYFVYFAFFLLSSHEVFTRELMIAECLAALISCQPAKNNLNNIEKMTNT